MEHESRETKRCAQPDEVSMQVLDISPSMLDNNRYSTMFDNLLDQIKNSSSTSMWVLLVFAKETTLVYKKSEAGKGFAYKTIDHTSDSFDADTHSTLMDCMLSRSEALAATMNLKMQKTQICTALYNACKNAIGIARIIKNQLSLPERALTITIITDGEENVDQDVDVKDDINWCHKNGVGITLLQAGKTKTALEHMQLDQNSVLFWDDCDHTNQSFTNAMSFSRRATLDFRQGSEFMTYTPAERQASFAQP